MSRADGAMRKTLTTTVDGKGRVVLPAELRENMGIQPGDSLFINEEGDTFRIAKAINPFDVLAQHALSEHSDGKTKDLREHWGDELDEDESDERR